MAGKVPVELIEGNHEIHKTHEKEEKKDSTRIHICLRFFSLLSWRPSSE